VKPLRVAMAGAGYFAQFHLDGWRRAPSVEVTGVCDLNLAKAEALAARFALPRALGSVEDLLDAGGVDLLDIVAPPAAHAALVGEAARRGLNVVCQKPFGRGYHEARALAELADRAGITIAIHENFRFMPHFREMKRWVDAGNLGALHSIAFRLRPGDGQGSDAYLSRQPAFQSMPRFLVFETAIHLIDTFRFLVGEIDAVTARLRRLNPAIVGEDAGYLVFEFAGGATGLFDGNRLNDHVAANPRRTMGECWLEGEAGVLRLDGDARLWWKPHHREETEHAYDRGRDDTFGGGACDALQAHVVRHLREGAPLENSAAGYLPNMKILEAAYASHATGRRIEMHSFEPPETR